MNLLWVKVWIRRSFSQCNSASFTLLQPVWVCSWLSSCHFVEHLSSPDSSAAQMRLKETQFLVTDSNQNKQKTCSSLHLQPLQSCVVLHCQIHRHVAPLSALETRVGVCLAVRLPGDVFCHLRWRIQTWTVSVSSCFLLSVSLSLSISQSAHLAHSCSLPLQSATHVLLGRAPVAMETVARPPVNLSSHDPRGGRAPAAELGHVMQAGSPSRDSPRSKETTTGIRNND